MTTTFFCERPIDAFYLNGQRHACVARGIFTTNDAHLAAFLKTYPGVSMLSQQPEKPAAFHPGQYDQCPEPVRVIHGGFSGGGAAAARLKAPMGNTEK